MKTPDANGVFKMTWPLVALRGSTKTNLNSVSSYLSFWENVDSIEKNCEKLFVAEILLKEGSFRQITLMVFVHKQEAVVRSSRYCAAPSMRAIELIDRTGPQSSTGPQIFRALVEKERPLS